MDYDRLADRQLVVEGVQLGRHERATSSGFTRVSSVFSLHGEGAVGRGEDVTYDAADHDRLHAAHQADWALDLAGEWTLATFASHLDSIDLFPEEPAREAAHHYRRWALESAALDLALRQAETDLASAVGGRYEPVGFVVSTRLGDAGIDRLDEILAVAPGAAFKLDPTDEWDAALVDELASRYRDRIRILDLKGHYTGTDVDTSPDPDRYRRLRDAFPDAVIEDPAITPETRAVLEPARTRLSWDAPVTGVASIEALPFEPDWLNIKPSRFGTLATLCETLAYAADHDITLYGGGQFELGVGREHIQALASLCYPDGPNDVAPIGYNDPSPAADLPGSPLAPPADPAGMDWR